MVFSNGKVADVRHLKTRGGRAFVRVLIDGALPIEYEFGDATAKVYTFVKDVLDVFYDEGNVDGWEILDDGNFEIEVGDVTLQIELDRRAAIELDNFFSEVFGGLTLVDEVD